MKVQSISIINLSYLPLFDHLNFEIKRGDCYRIEGPSGVGKTTLLKIITKAIHDTSREQFERIEITGNWQVQDFSPPKEGSMKGNPEILGIQFQSTLSSYAPYLSLYDQIIPPLVKTKKITEKLALDKMESNMKKLGFQNSDLLYRKPQQISGGQLQRIDFSFLLSLDPDVYLMDEPLSGLDIENQSNVVQQLKELQRNKKIILYSSHNDSLFSGWVNKTISIRNNECENKHSNTILERRDLSWIPLPKDCVTLRANITKSYKTPKDKRVHTVLHNLKISTQKENNFIGILGESGKGKSTLMRILSGLTEADKGSILQYSKSEPTKRIMFQSTIASLNPKLTIGYHFKEIEKGRIAKGITALELDQSAFDRYPTEVSGGQLQRFVFLKNILQSPEILFLDEPFLGLDPKQVATMTAILEYIASQRKTTIFLASHENYTLYNIMTSKVVL
jgi:peptide/nickel transport system ATP-binding protein